MEPLLIVYKLQKFSDAEARIVKVAVFARDELRVGGIRDGDRKPLLGRGAGQKFIEARQRRDGFHCEIHFRAVFAITRCRQTPINRASHTPIVWTSIFAMEPIIRLLEDPALIQTEIDRRREVARNTDPFRKRQEELRREQVRIEKNSERLVTAYQEGLVTLPQLRQRMPALQKQAQAIGSELQSLEMAAVDDVRYLQLAKSLAGFRTKLRSRADTLDLAVRQQILRLVLKEVLVGTDTITLRHSIPIPQSGPESNGPPNRTAGGTGLNPTPSYLLRSGSHIANPSQSLPAPRTRPLGRPARRRAVPGAVAGAAGEVRAGATPGEDASDRVWALRRRAPEEAWPRETGDVQLFGFQCAAEVHG